MLIIHKVHHTYLASMLILCRQLVIGRNYAVHFYNVCGQECIMTSFLLQREEEEHVIFWPW